MQENESISFTNDLTFFVGENGTGNSALPEAIAVAFGFNAEGGSRNSNFSTNNTHSELFSHLTLARTAYPKGGFFLRAESLYNSGKMYTAPSEGGKFLGKFKKTLDKFTVS